MDPINCIDVNENPTDADHCFDDSLEALLHIENIIIQFQFTSQSECGQQDSGS